MVTSKIITLLKGFNENDISAFREFLLSPYFNKKKKLVSYFEYLVKYHPGYPEEKTNKKAVYKKLFPKSRFNEQVFKNLSSELYHLAKEFLAVERFRSDKLSTDMDVLKALEERGADALFETEYKQLTKHLDNMPYDDTIFLKKFNLKDIRLLYLYNRNMQKEELNTVLEWGDELFKFFIINLSRALSSLNIRRVLFNAQFKENVSEVFINDALRSGVLASSIDFLEKNKVEGWEKVQIRYYLALAIMFPENEIYYSKAKELFFAIFSGLSRAHAMLITQALLAVCIRKINQKKSIKNHYSAFEIIEFQFRNSLHKASEDSYITVFTYRNAFMIALALNKIKWLEDFSRKYINEVTPEKREHLEHHSAAYIEFTKGNFENSLEHLSKITFDQFIYKLDVRSLSLLNYYEMGYYENVRSLIISFKAFLDTNKFVSPLFKKTYSRFIEKVKKLVLLTETFEADAYVRLKNDTAEDINGFLAEWFEKKLEEIYRKNNKSR